MKKGFSGLLCVFLFFGFLSPCFGEEEGKRFELTLFGGMFFSDDDFQENNGGGGVRFTYYFSDIFGIEGGLGIIPVSSQLIIDGPDLLSIDTNAFTYNGNVVVHFLRGRVMPFAVGGLGGTTYHFASFLSTPSGEFESKNTETYFTLNYGGGVKFIVGRNIGLRADIRGYRIFNDSGDINMLETSGGVSFFF